MTESEVIKLVLQLTGKQDITEAAAELGKLKGQAEQTAQAHTQLGQGALSASYAFQDLTSVLAGGGGFARALSSVQNNIPALLMSLGATGGLAGIVSIASVAVGVLIDRFVSASDKGQTLKGHMEAVNQAIEAYRDKLVHTNSELAEYNRLLGEQQKLREQERQRALEAKAYEVKEPAPGARQQERAAILERMIAGQESEVRGAVTEAVGAYNQPQRDKLQAEMASLDEQISRRSATEPAFALQGLRNRREAIRRRLDRLPAAYAKAGAELFGQARTGDARAIGQIQTMLGAESPFADAFRLASVEEQRAQRAAAQDADQQAARHKEDAELRTEDQRKRDDAMHTRQLGMGKIEFQKREKERLEDEADKAKEAGFVERDIEAAIPRVGTGARRREQEARRAREAAKQQEQANARQAVIAASQNMGFGTPTEQQASDMAADAVRNLETVGNSQQAVMMAVMSKMQAITAATERLAEQQQAMQDQMAGLGTALRYGPAQQQRSALTMGLPY